MSYAHLNEQESNVDALMLLIIPYYTTYITIVHHHTSYIIHHSTDEQKISFLRWTHQPSTRTSQQLALFAFCLSLFVVVFKNMVVPLTAQCAHWLMLCGVCWRGVKACCSYKYKYKHLHSTCKQQYYRIRFWAFIMSEINHKNTRF
jgi:hypothetical protein